MNRVRSPLIWAICLLGLAGASACALPADPVDPDAPQWGIDPIPSSEPWSPSAEWLDLYERDREVSDLLQQSLDAPTREEQLELYDQYMAAQRELEDYFIQNPDADAPCPVRLRHAPPELWCSAQQANL